MLSRLLLAAFVVASLGLMPSPRLIGRFFGAELDTRFPCAGGPCGCSSAFECWTRCNCHTRSQRIAWLRDEGLPPPSFVTLTAAEQAWLAQPPCCADRTPQEPTCCSPPVESGGAGVGCCASPLDCKGRRPWLVMLAPPVPPLEAHALLRPMPMTGSVRPPAGPAPRPCALDIPTPPPRSA